MRYAFTITPLTVSICDGHTPQLACKLETASASRLQPPPTPHVNGKKIFIARKKPFIDWNDLKNPVLSYPNWSVKDTAMVYRNATVTII